MCKSESAKQCIDEGNSDDQKTLKENSNESFMACAFSRNCDSLKHGSLENNFQMQHVLNDNQCPKKVSAVSDVLGSHQWDQSHNDKKKKKKEQRQESGQNNNDNSNNNKANNESESATQLAQYHSHAMCHCCGEKGHCVSDCPMKDEMAKKQLGNEERHADGARLK